MGRKTNSLGIVSAFATFYILLVISSQTHTLIPTLQEIGLFLSGGVHEIAARPVSFLHMWPLIASIIVIDLLFAVGIGMALLQLLKQRGQHKLEDTLDGLSSGEPLFWFFATALIEELFARWFFLGVLTKIPFLKSAAAFYVLLFIGNTLWSLAHLRNYKDKRDRHPLRLFSQFVGGLFYAYLYVKCGLLAVVLTHFGSNAVLFAVHKVQTPTLTDGLIIGYNAVCAIMSYALMTKPLTDLLPWFNDQPVFRLEGWEFWDYFKVAIFCSSALPLLFDLLLYDRDEAPDEKTSLLGYLKGYIVGIPLMFGFLLSGDALLSLAISSMPYRILILSITVSCLHTSISGNHLARGFWIRLPDAYVCICLFHALSWPAVVAYILLEALILLPRSWLQKDAD